MVSAVINSLSGVVVSQGVVVIRQYKTLGCVAIFLLTGAESIAADWQSLWRRPDQQAHQKLMDGLNLYQQGDYEQAQKEFATVGDETAMYNQGVTAVKQGEYEGAIEKFESVLKDNPAHENAGHNLQIAKELAEKQQQQQQQGDQGDQDHQDEGEEQQSDNTQDGEQQQGQDSEQQGEGEQQGDAQSADTDEQQEKNQQGGELASDTQDVSDKNEAEQAAQSADQKQAEQEQAMQSQQGGDQQGDPESDEQAAAAALTQAPTEGEQATEQWLRRIQDDPSQLLRNKIKLNHMIEHADVRDMQEPW